MNRMRAALLAVTFFAVVLTGCGGGEDGAAPPATAPTSQPGTGSVPPTGAGPETPDSAVVPETLAFTAPTVDGGELDGADLAGAPVVFWFWAAWCPRCAAAAGDVREVAAEYDGRVHTVGVAGLGSGEDGMRQFVDQHELAGFPHLADDDGEVWRKFGVTTQEYFVVLDAGGVIVHDGPLAASELRDQLGELVG